ncbi:DUF4468 domain-containing protein [Algoriphagus aquimarinus]|uniref:DUF4468 domain-containing protein n=1 Tax=Algoriphagus aquimarinus TaxID=237018 RepID=A0A5C7AP21_9BACT|nr:DUF4468 domain-containing protein [Algoriphagus aquimarinus]TXE07562.1 DUF4468 domain-containing protein [Algoriphagus aquimarinus]
MKKIFFPCICLIASVFLTSCLGSKALQETPQPKIATFENEHDKDTNFILANEWMVETFNNAQSVIQFTDKESGTVKGKYIVRAGYTSTSPYIASTEALFSIITIRVKDNGCRIEIDPPNTQFYSQKSMGTEFGYTTTMFEEATNKLIEDFKSRMLGDSIGDW